MPGFAQIPATGIWVFFFFNDSQQSLRTAALSSDDRIGLGGTGVSSNFSGNSRRSDLFAATLALTGFGSIFEVYDIRNNLSPRERSWKGGACLGRQGSAYGFTRRHEPGMIIRNGLTANYKVYDTQNIIHRSALRWARSGGSGEGRPASAIFQRRYARPTYPCATSNTGEFGNSNYDIANTQLRIPLFLRTAIGLGLAFCRAVAHRDPCTRQHIPKERGK